MEKEIKKILVIEDDPIERLTLIKSLKREGYLPISAETGEEGIEKFKKEKPDLVILDIVLPGMDGWTVVGKIKSGPISKRTPVIMLTGKDTDTDKIKGYEFGADYYMTKPYNIQKLLIILKEIIKS